MQYFNVNLILNVYLPFLDLATLRSAESNRSPAEYDTSSIDLNDIKEKFVQLNQIYENTIRPYHKIQYVNVDISQ